MKYLTQSEVREAAKSAIGSGANYSNRNVSGRTFKYMLGAERSREVINGGKLADTFRGVGNVYVSYSPMYMDSVLVTVIDRLPSAYGRSTYRTLRKGGMKRWEAMKLAYGV